MTEGSGDTGNEVQGRWPAAHSRHSVLARLPGDRFALGVAALRQNRRPGQDMLQHLTTKIKKPDPFGFPVRHLIFVLTLLLAGCATLCDQKSCFQQIGEQDLMNLVRHHPTGPDSVVWYAYAGSDADYDYLYSFVPNVFPGHNSDYHYYKLKTGILNLSTHSVGPWEPPARADFGISKSNPMILSNDGTDAENRKALTKLLNP